MKELAYIVAFLGLFVPGFATARLFMRGGLLSTQIVVAPVLSFGLAYLVGLIANAFKLPALTSTLVVLVSLSIVWIVVEIVWMLRAVGFASRLRIVRAQIREQTPARFVAAALLVAALGVGFMLWHRFQAPFVVPPGWDAMHHGYFVRQIILFDSLDTPIVLAPTPGGSDGSVSFYPLAYNLYIALLHSISGLPISMLMLTSTTVIAGLALPVGMYFLARRLCTTRPLVAGAAALASSLPIYLYWVLEPGRTNAVIGLALVPSLVLFMIVDGWKPRWRNAPIAAVAVAGLTGVHTSELPMAAVVVGAIMVTAAIQQRELNGLLRWCAWAITVALSAVVAILFLEPGLLGASSQRTEIFVNIGAHAIAFKDAIFRVLVPGYDLGLALTGGNSPQYFAWMWGALVLVGCILTFFRSFSAFRGAAIAYIAFVLLAFGLLTNTLGPLAFLTIPWYQDAGRFWWTLTVLGALPAAIALVAIAELCVAAIGSAVAALSRRNTAMLTPAKSELSRAVGAGAIVLFVVFGTTMPPVAQAAASINENKGPVRGDSLAAFEYLAQTVKPGERVFDDMRVDGSLWMFIDHSVPTLFGNSPYVGAEPESWLERLWLRENLDQVGRDSCVGAMLEKYSVAYIYFGERIMTDAYHRIDLEFLRSDPHFTEVFSEGQSHVFRIDTPHETSSCVGDLTPTTKNAF